MASLRVGDPAPDFELPGNQGAFRLSEHRGARVVLLFYPGDDTTVCTKQFCSYRDRAQDISQLGATLVGISTKDASSKRAFADKYGLQVPLLADEDGSVAGAYGVTSRFGGFTKRAMVIVDEEGRVAFTHTNPLSLTFDDVDEIRAELDRLAASA